MTSAFAQLTKYDITCFLGRSWPVSPPSPPAAGYVAVIISFFNLVFVVQHVSSLGLLHNSSTTPYWASHSYFTCKCSRGTGGKDPGRCQAQPIPTRLITQEHIGDQPRLCPIKELGKLQMSMFLLPRRDVQIGESEPGQ